MSAGRRLRVLLVLKHAGYAGVYAALVRELAKRGHEVRVAYLAGDPDGVATLERLAADPRIEQGRAARRGALDGWASVAWLARALGDLGRFSHPRFATAPVLRDRMAAKVEGTLASAAGFDPLTRRIARRQARRLHASTDARLAARAIRAGGRLDRAVPTSRRVASFVREQRPDVVLASPVVELASPLVEYLKAARSLGLPTGICVASWDNLSSKGLLRFVPERVFVWNETQRREAVELHGIPADRVVATGAPRFDAWFDQRVTRSREEFARALGLDPGRPYLLYLCSSAFVAPGEVEFVGRWLEALRRSDDERLRTIGVVVRPHPKRTAPWLDVDLSRFGNAVVWTREGITPDTDEARAAFYDSIAHSAAVVGVNTSAMLEAAIAGRSVYTLLAPEFAQEGTLHFHYLLHQGGGFLHVASSLGEHLAQLAAGLARADADAKRTRAFVERFIRPAGLERRASEVYAEAIEELASLEPSAPATTPGALVLRAALAPLALASTAALAVAVGKAALRARLSDDGASERGGARVGAARTT